MLLDKKNTTIPGCFELLPNTIIDERGCFVKTFHLEEFRKLGLSINFVEEYFTKSVKGVIRGLHFQTPPMEHTKLVTCIQGEVMDVVLDLRVGSPVYGKFQIFTLSSEDNRMLYLPPGLAHGFLVLSSDAIINYKVTSVYSPEHDSGILWNSLNIPWSTGNPIISTRDKCHMAFSDFNSPFIYKEN